jgi:hypothetical protein
LGDQRGDLAGTLRVEFGDGLCGAAVQLTAPLGQQGGEGDLAGQRMAEGVDSGRVDLGLGDQLGLAQPLEQHVQLGGAM